MKKVFLIMVALVAFVSCKKNEVAGDNGCISQRQNKSFGLNTADSLAALQLLTNNHMPTNDIQMERIELRDTINGTHIYQYIAAIQLIKGLPVLSDDFGYNFRDGIYQQTSGKKYTSVSLNTHPTLSLRLLRSLYMAEVKKNNNATYSANFKDSCLVARFGYYNLNAGTGNETPDIIKAWAVTPKNADYPVAIFRDDNGNTIIYNTGIVTF
ncbi:MAG TPA: hypothetical protein VJ844_07255 [Mucilaginibacter sp.]|nr:hypothetical protein [Mucilaginibacter sp.]